MKNFSYILDIGSSKISLLVCSIVKTKSIIITSADCEYDGFMDGEFFSTEQVRDVIHKLVSLIETRVKKKINNILFITTNNGER